jgi:prophage antirepressor-like protein
MSSEQVLNFGELPVGLFMCKGEPWFKASDITTILMYKQCAPAIDKHVSKKYVQTLHELNEKASDGVSTDVTNHHICKNEAWKSPFYLKEPGVYELAFSSKKPEAVKFREWVVEEVLPEIRRTGRYVRNKQVSLMTEKDLHFKVVDFIKKYWPESLRIAGLGELQDSITKRVEAWHKGYSKGQPDLIVLNRTKDCSGLAIELKTPLGIGKTSPE